MAGADTGLAVEDTAVADRTVAVVGADHTVAVVGADHTVAVGVDRSVAGVGVGRTVGAFPQFGSEGAAGDAAPCQAASVAAVEVHRRGQAVEVAFLAASVA